MPVTVTADGVSLSHLVIRGVGATSRQRSACGQPNLRPMGGGLRVSGSRFTLNKSVLRNFACYTAMEITAGSKSLTITNNVIGPNGDHRPGEIWSDGITIHDASSAIVSGNTFVDNTDVQLILGGCRNCRIIGNRFRHSPGVSSASFAELMLHSWPSTSGDFLGTVVERNSIDCGPQRRCGYGLMIGAAPWYPGKMTGGTISRNVVSNAMVAVNIDGLTGPVSVAGNSVRNSGGRFRADCGTRMWASANVAPSSRKFVKGDPTDQSESSVSTAKCLLNR